MAVGVGGLYIGNRDFQHRYDNEKMWGRLRPQVERNYSRDPAARARTLDNLRVGLSGLDPKGEEERCRFETRFTALVTNGGNFAAADADIKARSFEPYAQCKPLQLGDRLNYGNLASVSLLVLGLYGMARSFFGKKEQNQ